MSALTTVASCLNDAYQGVGLRNKIILFLAAGLGCMGNNRKTLKPLFVHSLNFFQQTENLRLVLESIKRR